MSNVCQMRHKTLMKTVQYILGYGLVPNIYLETDLPPLYAEDKGAKIYLDCEFPVPVDTLFSLLWLPSSPFWSAYMTHRKTKNWTCEEWRTESDGKIMRECKCLQVRNISYIWSIPRKMHILELYQTLILC